MSSTTIAPQESGRLVEENTADRRVKVLYNASNLGVGGATLVGMRQAATDGADVIVKIDGDGQMDPALIPAHRRHPFGRSRLR